MDSKLTQAAIDADTQPMSQRIEQVSHENDSLASILTNLVNNFQFGKIIDLIQQLQHEKQQS